MDLTDAFLMWDEVGSQEFHVKCTPTEDVQLQDLPVQCTPTENLESQESPATCTTEDNVGRFDAFRYSWDICVDMVFASEEEAIDNYSAYARRAGFSCRTNHIRLFQGRRVDVDFVCNREGKRRATLKRPIDANKEFDDNKEFDETRIGCNTMIHVKMTEDGSWKVIKFVREHNHELLTPFSAKLIFGNLKVSKAQKNLIDLLDEAGILANKIDAALEEGPSENTSTFVPKNINNYLCNKRRKLLAEGDAQRLITFFIECKSNNLYFIYDVEVDEQGRMGNCFWVNGRSVKAYKYFGQAVAFDATYMSNCYNMSFIPFTGVNHHRQSVMFGCALLRNETARSYTWLLKTWLQAMGGQPPKSIITDDDKAMAKAIAKVPEHLGHIMHKYPKFKEQFHYCLHLTRTTERIEFEWAGLLSDFNLEENIWLRDLYNRKLKWVPAYVRSSFCAGMSMTQRSESMNKYFKDYVRSSTTTSAFVYQYAKALKAQCLKEKSQDAKTASSIPILKTCYTMEIVATQTFTRKMFKIFQEELFSSQMYKTSKLSDIGDFKVYGVTVQGRKGSTYKVLWNRMTNTGECDCHMMEFVGMICRQLLVVLVKKSIVEELPGAYVKARWTIYKRADYEEALNEALSHVTVNPSDVVRRADMRKQFERIADIAEKSHDDYAYVMQAFDEIILHICASKQGENLHEEIH